MQIVNMKSRRTTSHEPGVSVLLYIRDRLMWLEAHATFPQFSRLVKHTRAYNSHPNIPNIVFVLSFSIILCIFLHTFTQLWSFRVFPSLYFLCATVFLFRSPNRKPPPSESLRTALTVHTAILVCVCAFVYLYVWRVFYFPSKLYCFHYVYTANVNVHTHICLYTQSSSHLRSSFTRQEQKKQYPPKTTLTSVQ